MSPSHTSRYYVSQTVLQGDVENCPIRRVSAAAIEAAVVDQLRALLCSPEVVVATWRAARPEMDGLFETAVRDTLERLDPLWEELFPAEQARIVQLLVARVDVKIDGLELHLRTQGLGRMVDELGGMGMRRAA